MRNKTCEAKTPTRFNIDPVFSGTKFLTNGIKNEFFVFSDWLIKYTPQGETAKVTVPEGIFGISAYALTDADNTVVLPKSLRAASATAFNSDLKNIDTGDNPVYAYKDGILFREGTVTFYKNGRKRIRDATLSIIIHSFTFAP